MTWNIDRQSVLVTGGSSGIGQATAEALAGMGANVTITSRDAARGEKARSAISRATGRSVRVELMDLSDLGSVRDFADRFRDRNEHLRLLVNNAGGVFGSRRETVDGHETTFATNHLGPFLLTSLLSESLEAAGRSRVINVSSVAHRYAKEGIVFGDLAWKNRRYKMMEVYGHSKLANILHAQGLNDRTGPNAEAFAVHPGVVGSSFGGRGGSKVVRAATKFGKRWMRTPAEGADTIVWLASEPEVETSDGIYFSDREPTKSTRHARDVSQADRLWDVTEKLVSLA